MSLDPTPLLDAARRRQPWHVAEGVCPGCDGLHREVAVCVAADDVAVRLGVSGAAVRSWRIGRNQIAERDAERYAAVLGLLDYEVWPELLERAVDEATTVCPTCEERFTPKSRNHRFCSRSCNQRSPESRARRAAAAKRRYDADPENRAKRLAQSAAYREECREAFNASRRRYYAKNAERERAYAAERRARLRSEAA